MRSIAVDAAGLVGRRGRALPLAVLLFAAGIATTGVAVAAPLAKEACDALKSEQVALSGSGVREDMARGAAWAKGNLGPDRLKRIARLIEVNEQIVFRCPAPLPEIESVAKPAPKPQLAKQAKPAAGDGQRPKLTGTKAGDGAAANAPGGKLEPQSANVSANTPAGVPDKSKKPTKAEAAAAKKRAAAAATKAQAKIKPADAFVTPPGAPTSTLQAPAAAAQPKEQ